MYNKFTTENNDILKLLEKYNIKYKNINYGKYHFEDWINELQKCNFVIFNQNCIETQGLSMAEAWAYNKPTFIQYIENKYEGLTSPYMTKECGLYYKNLNELETLIKEYSKDRKIFMEKFQPYKYVKENLSDEVSVKKLIDIFNQIDINNHVANEVQDEH